MKGLRTLFLVGLLVLSCAGELLASEPPFFRASPQFPNAFIIFDNSDSMQDVPYLDVNGLSIRPSGREWRQNVTIDVNNRVTGWANVTWPTYLSLDQNANPTHLASGGSHPSSKLYQAKLALNRILDTVDEVNLGFATYMSQRVPLVVARYYRHMPTVSTTGTAGTSIPVTVATQWQFLGVRPQNTFPTMLQPWPDKFTFAGPNPTYNTANTVNGAAEGGNFSRVFQTSLGAGCPLNLQTVTYTITSVIERYGTDGQFLGYNWALNAPYLEYSYRTINDANYDAACIDTNWNACAVAATSLPASNGGFSRVTAGAGCNLWRKIPGYSYMSTPVVVTAYSRPDYYTVGWITSQGNWAATSAAAAGYIDPSTYEVTPVSTSGGVWYLVDTSMSVAHLGAWNAAAGTIDPARQRSDYFIYPGVGDANRPHAWSYVKRVTNPTGDWPLTSQLPAVPASASDPGPFYYPGTMGNENGNLLGDDHSVFVGLPSGNDTSMANRAAIRQFVGLERYSGHPQYPSYDFTFMPYTLGLTTPNASIAPNVLPVVYWGGGSGKATPLAATLRWAKQYFKSYINSDDQSKNRCRENFIIFLTDGLDTADCDPSDANYETCLSSTDPSSPNSPARAALELKNVQLATGGPNYEVNTFVIGFGLDASQAGALNAMANAGWPSDASGFVNRIQNSGCVGCDSLAVTQGAFFASTVDELVQILNCLFCAFAAGHYSRSDLTISREGDRLYQAYFDYPGWSGHLKAFVVNDDGSVGSEVSNWGSGSGDAGDSISGQTTRTVYTTHETGPQPTRIKFTETGDAITFVSGALSDLKPILLPGGEDIDGDTVANEDEDAEKVLKFILNSGYDDNTGDVDDEPYNGERTATWKFGDLYHTRPVVVGKPGFSYTFNNYPDFKTTNEHRDVIIYVGSNGGMLHAIRAAQWVDTDSDSVLDALEDWDGAEIWSYIPRLALGNLKDLKVEHQFFVDSRPTVADIYSTGTGGGNVFSTAGWYTVLVCGLREGGRGVFALDITNPNDPKILWEFTHANMGETWSVPALGRVKEGTNDKWVAILGGGWTGATGSTPANDDTGNRVYIIDIETGALLRQGSTDAVWTVGSTMNKVPSAIQAVDLDRNGYFEAVYFGDYEGAMWKMDLSSTDISNWAPCKLFDAASPTWNAAITSPPTISARPIFHQPAVARADTGYNLVFFGTGNEKDATNTTTYDFFYEVEDKGSLVAGTPPTCAGTINWVEELPQGEKVLARPAVFNRVVYFTSYSPTGMCGGGVGYLWGLTMSSGSDSTGGGQAGLYFDSSGTALGTPIEKRTLGTGVPTAPIVTNGTIYVTTSNEVGDPGDIITQQINPLGGIIRGWREVF